MYTIIKAAEVAELVRKVNKLIQEGWKPLGGMVIGRAHYYQTMIKVVTA